jgi:hypothetical protein
LNKTAGAALLLGMAILFLLANRGSYKGYFQDDELNNLSWTRDIPALEFGKAALSPKFFPNNFRPVGHFYFREMSLLYGLDFPKYLPILHLAHFLNAWMVWMLARRLGLPPLASSMGALFFAFHMAAFDIYWKPMYVFDLLCATFCLASLLLYIGRRYILSFCAFWLAYKSKELAVMLPVVLAGYEFWLAKPRRWTPLIPFFVVSFSFGVQSILLNQNIDNDYTFRFTPAALRTTLSFYSSSLLLEPYAGLALIPLPFLSRDRRVWFGAAMLWLFLAPLLFLPGRLFAAYCYLPLAGLAVMASAAAAMPRLTAVIACLCVLWIPFNVAQLKKNRRATLAADDEVRAYVSALVDYARVSSSTRTFVFDGLPAGYHSWGTEGVLRLLYGYPNPALYHVGDKEAAAALKMDDVALLAWDPVERRLAVFSSKSPLPYVDRGRRAPPWQLGDGWFEPENGFRWTGPHAGARISSPRNTAAFELVVNISTRQLQETGPARVALKLDGIDIGSRQVTQSGVQTLRWPVRAKDAGTVAVDLAVTPEYRPSNGDPRRLGLAVVAFGFR